MAPIKQVTIEVTTETIWFVERYLNVFDFADIFPKDAFSNGRTKGAPVTLHTDIGFDIVTDIDRGKMQLRNRSKVHGWTRWIGEKKLSVGDRIVIEKLGEREFGLSLERMNDEG
jgi:hypothetical protein